MASLARNVAGRVVRVAGEGHVRECAGSMVGRACGPSTAVWGHARSMALVRAAEEGEGERMKKEKKKIGKERKIKKRRVL